MVPGSGNRQLGSGGQWPGTRRATRARQAQVTLEIPFSGKNWEDYIAMVFNASNRNNFTSIHLSGEQPAPGEQKGHKGQALYWRLVASAPVLASRSLICTTSYVLSVCSRQQILMFVLGTCFSWYLSAKHPGHMETNHQQYIHDEINWPRSIISQIIHGWTQYLKYWRLFPLWPCCWT